MNWLIQTYRACRITSALLLLLLFLPRPHAGVVINEILYHAPNDLEDLEFIELHNDGSHAINLGGWKFTKGIDFTFPPSTKMEPGSYLLLARDKNLLRQFFDVKTFATFSQKLSNNGERLELSDDQGAVIDTVRYGDKAPWPLGADGYSGSLERICPAASGEDPSNWASSPLTEDRSKPGGSPGAKNSCHSVLPLPVISKVTFGPEVRAVGEELSVHVETASLVSEMRLLFKSISPEGTQSDESTVPMVKTGSHIFTSVIPSSPAHRLIRFRLQAISTNGTTRFYPAETEPRPAFSIYIQPPIESARIPFAWILKPGEFSGADSQLSQNLRHRSRGSYGRRNRSKLVSPHDSALIYFDPSTRKTELFDFVQVPPRSSGHKVKFHSDKTLHGMTTINLIYETDAAVILEPLAYEVYRRAGLATQQSHHARLWINGHPLGFHLLFEQPNKGFLRRHNIADDGNLYKLIWYGGDVVGQHEKKTNPHTSHEDIVRLIKVLDHTQPDPQAQWKVIQQNFDVDQVAGYFAVNMLLNHWDGFFNNYFTYHDVSGTGKWTLYPWDQDQTWGFVNGYDQLLSNLPITFGMIGDIPPGHRKAPNRGEYRFGRGSVWWRPPGFFSGPLLANPEFRKLFLAKTRHLLESIFTREIFGPIIRDMAARLEAEVRLHAELANEDPESALANFRSFIAALQQQLTDRRAFLLGLPELKNAGQP